MDLNVIRSSYSMNNSSHENLFFFYNSILDSEWFTPGLYPTYLVDPDPTL